MKCPKCGSENKPNAKFCSSCGYNLKEKIITNFNDNSSNKKTIIRGNSKSKIYHCPGQRDYENMSDSVYLINFNSEEEAIAAGYRKASR